MLVETSWLLPVVVIYLFGIADSSTSYLSQNPLTLNLLLVAARIVTTVPLVLLLSSVVDCACRPLAYSSIWVRR